MDSKNNFADLKSALRAARLSLLMTQREMAHFIGVTSQSVSDYERGRRPAIRILKKYAEILGVSAENLVDLAYGEKKAHKD